MSTKQKMNRNLNDLYNYQWSIYRRDYSASNATVSKPIVLKNKSRTSGLAHSSKHILKIGTTIDAMLTPYCRFSQFCVESFARTSQTETDHMTTNVLNGK